MADESVMGRVTEDVAALKQAAAPGQTIQVPVNNYWDPSADPALDAMRQQAARQLAGNKQFFILYLDPGHGVPLPVLDKRQPKRRLSVPQLDGESRVIEVSPPLSFNTLDLARGWIKLMGMGMNRYLVVEAVSDFDPKHHIPALDPVPTHEELNAFLLEIGFERYDNSQVTRAAGEEVFVGWRHSTAGFMLAEQGLVGESWRRLALRIGWL